jgi:hypothetical protein
VLIHVRILRFAFCIFHFILHLAFHLAFFMLYFLLFSAHPSPLTLHASRFTLHYFDETMKINFLSNYQIHSRRAFAAGFVIAVPSEFN